MKKSLLKRIAAWTAAVALILSPAGADLAGVTALAAESISANENSENTDGENIENDGENNDENGDNNTDNNNDESNGDNNSDNNNDENNNDDDNGSNEDNNDSNDENTDGNNDNNNNDENTDNNTDNDDNNNENNNDDESNDEDETDDEETEENDFAYVEHYVSPISGEGLLPYEYYYLGEIEIEEGEEPESFVEASSYNESLSNYSSKNGYNALSATLKKVYDNAYNALVTIDSSAEYDATEYSGSGNYYFDEMLVSDTLVSEGDLFKVFSALSKDNPQFFWFGHGYMYSTSGTNTYMYFGVDSYCSDCYDGETRMEIKEQVMTEIASVIDGAEAYGNEYSKEWYIHNYLCENNVYDLNAEHAHDISGILVGGRAVCESYAKCFQLFMNALDIDVLYVVGTGNGGGHAWNQVGLDNNGTTEWYNVDVTWDDGSDSYDYNYFNVIDSAGGYYDFTNGYNGHNEHTPITTTHKEYLYPVNKCTSTTYSYANHDDNYAEAGDAVAQIGSKTFYSLDAAIKSIKSSGQIITLLADAKYRGATMPSYSFTIDGDSKYNLTFGTNMTLNADLTIKNIAGSDRSDYDYSVSTKTITIGTYTLTLSGNKNHIPVTICGNTTKNKGSVVIQNSNVSIFSIQNVENLTVGENTSLTLDAGAWGTNFTLGKNATIINSCYIYDEVYYSDCVSFTKLNQSAGSVLKIDKFVSYNGFSFDTVNTSVGITLTVDGYLDEETLEYAPLLIKNKIPVDNIILNGDAGFAALSRYKNGDEYYCYFLEKGYNFSITDGTTTAKRVTLDEIVEYISEKNNANADYVISKTNSKVDLIDVEGTLFNSVKAKSITFDVYVSVDSDFTLKCPYTFNSGAVFYGKVNAGSNKLTLGKGDYYYYFNNAVTSTSTVEINGGMAFFAGTYNDKTVTRSVKEISILNDGYLHVNGGSLKITSALSLVDSRFNARNDAKVEIASIVSTGESVINSYNGGTVTVTGNVTLTDSRPIFLSCVDFYSDENKNVISSGQTAIIVKGSKVTVDLFTTVATTSSGASATLTKVGNEIRYATAAFKCDGNSYSQWSDVLNYINNNPDSTKIFTVTILDDVTIDNLTFPAATKANGVKFVTGSDDNEINKVVTIKNSTLKVTVDFWVNHGVTLEMSSDKKCAVTVSAGKDFGCSDYGRILNAGKITGTSTSNLYCHGGMDAVSISTFKSVEGDITVSGTVTGVTFTNATVKMLTGSNVTASTVLSERGGVTFKLVEKAGSALPKLTLNSVGEKTIIWVVDESGSQVAVASGTIVAYSSKEPANSITILNKSDSDKELNAVYYSSAKAIKAEYTGAITLSKGDQKIDDFSSFENLFNKINNLKEKNAVYTITLNDSVSASSFKLPTYASEINFTALSSKTISLSNVTAISLPMNVSFTNIRIESTKPFTMTASKNLTLEHFTSDTVKQIKGGAKSVLTWGKENDALPIASFGKVIIEENATFTPKTSMSFTDLEICDHATLYINDGINVTIKNIKGTSNSSITYASALYTPFTVSGTAEGTLNIGIDKDGAKFNVGQLVFKAASADLTCFNVREQAMPEGEYALSRDKSNVYLKTVSFTLVSDGKTSKMAEWSDIVSSIAAANNKTADYTVTMLREYYVMYSAMTMPKTGTYGSITIKSEGEKPSEIDFLGSSITLTGDTTFKNIAVYGFKKSGKSYKYDYYKINAGKYALTLDNIVAPINGITSSGELNLDSISVYGNVTAGSGKFHSVAIKGNITVKGMLSISGVNDYYGTLSVGGIEAVDTKTDDAAEIMMYYGKKFSVGKNGIGKDGTIKISFYDAKSGNYMKLDSGDKVADITGNYYGNVVLDGQEIFKVVRSGNKLVCVDAENASVYGLSINGSGPEYTYISLKDLIADINRMNDPTATYTITVYKDESIKGSLPLPSAKKYSEIRYTTVGDAEITVTGDIKLTGDLDISGAKIKKVNNKGVEQVMNYNIGAYTLYLGDVDTIGNINGAKGRLEFANNTTVSITGSVNVGVINNCDSGVVNYNLGSKASFNVAEILCCERNGENSIISYPYSIASKVKIGSANGASINILDASGKTIKIDESYAGKALMGQYKGSLANISLVNEIPDEYVLATGKSSMLTIAKPVCKVEDKQYASISDAVNSDDIVTIELLDDITMTEVLTIPKGKYINIKGENKTLKLKGTTLVNGSLTFTDLNVVDTSSKLGTSYKLSEQGILTFYAFKGGYSVDINSITTGKLENGYGIVGLEGVENANFNGSVKCRTIKVGTSTSNINLVKGKSVQLDECIDGEVTLVDANHKAVTIKAGDIVYKLTKAPDSIDTILNNTDANGKTHKLVYSNGSVKVGEAK